MILVISMQGLGDAFASRPTIAALIRKHGDVALATPYPEVFADLPLKIVTRHPDAVIRCARRNQEESKGYFNPYFEGVYERTIQLRYLLEPGCKDIPTQIAESAGVLDEVRWDDFFMGDGHSSGAIVRAFGQLHGGPLAVFRIPTIRTEYRNEARNPAPGLVAAAVDEIGGDFIHLNDFSTNENYESNDDLWILASRVHEIRNAKVANADFGQLSLPSMLDLVARARCVVTPVGWMCWAALAYQTPVLMIWGGYASPDTILGPIRQHVDLNAKLVVPDAECWCFNPSHECAKSIPVERVREAARCLK